MGIRIVVGLAQGAVAGQVAEGLRAAGAEEVLPPRAELPNVLIALFPQALGAPEAAERAARLPGVAYAEPEALRFSS
jgi:hypothetical protein